MLFQIREYIRRAGVVSDQQISREFQLDNSALQPMLDLWISKGIILKCAPQGASCKSSCFKCRLQPEYYQYKQGS